MHARSPDLATCAHAYVSGRSADYTLFCSQNITFRTLFCANDGRIRLFKSLLKEITRKETFLCTNRRVISAKGIVALSIANSNPSAPCVSMRTSRTQGHFTRSALGAIWRWLIASRKGSFVQEQCISYGVHVFPCAFASLTRAQFCM